MSAKFQLFDALSEPVEAALKASIERFGVLVPVVKDQHGNILDGHHRKRLADELGVTYRVDLVTVDGDDEAADIARTLNTARRHLSGDQLRDHIVFLAQQVDARGVGTLSANQIADVAGVDRKYVDRVLDDANEHGTSPMLPSHRQGADGKVRPAKRTVVAAKDEAEAAKGQEALALAGDNAPGGTLGVRDIAKVAARHREPEPVAAPVPPPDGQYSCLVIDPPWPMQKIERDERPNQGVALDYPVLDVGCTNLDYSYMDEWITEPTRCYEGVELDDAEYEPCKSIECVVGNVIETSAADDCHLYLWVTHRFLPVGLDLMRQWGFTYQCVMTWRKNVGITPFSWMYDTEHVLFGRRGNLPLSRMGLRLSFEAPVVGHSVKPDVFYERIIEASPGPRLEMFARTEREGFTPWGNEVNHAT